MYLLNNASGACQHTVITEHYANVNWMQIFPKPPACNIIHNGVKIYVKLHLMKHSKYIWLVLPCWICKGYASANSPTSSSLEVPCSILFIIVSWARFSILVEFSLLYYWSGNWKEIVTSPRTSVIISTHFSIVVKIEPAASFSTCIVSHFVLYWHFMLCILQNWSLRLFCK